MPEIASIGHGSVGPIDRSNHRVDRNEAAAASPRADSPRRGDRVELSDHARFLDELRRMPDVRQARVDAVRQAIADGTYETEERLEAAIDALMDELSPDEGAEH